MKIAVVIASTMRPATLAVTISSLHRQSRQADKIAVSVTGLDDLPQPLSDDVSVVYSERGLSRQRNEGIRSLPNDTDIIVFLDDDMVLHRDFMRGIEKIFEAQPGAALIMGHLLANGSVSVAKAIQMLDCPADSVHYHVKQATFGNVYGCNMSVRYAVALAEPFDERLPMYSYMEDMDFGTRVQRHGHVGYYYGSLAVHLRAKEGRVSQRSLGFSEVMNPAYLAVKGTIPRSHALTAFIIRKPLANIVRLVIGPQRKVRWNRLTGNFFALLLLCKGNVDPGQATEME